MANKGYTQATRYERLIELEIIIRLGPDFLFSKSLFDRPKLKCTWERCPGVAMPVAWIRAEQGEGAYPYVDIYVRNFALWSGILRWSLTPLKISPFSLFICIRFSDTIRIRTTYIIARYESPRVVDTIYNLPLQLCQMNVLINFLCFCFVSLKWGSSHYKSLPGSLQICSIIQPHKAF